MRTTLLASLLFVVACTDDPGKKPTIADLTFSPATVTVGQAATVSGSMTFDDEDGDLDKLAAEIVMPDLSRQKLPMSDVPGADGMTHGTLGFQMSFIPPAAGKYDFELWLTDEGDNESNHLAGSIMAN